MCLFWAALGRAGWQGVSTSGSPCLTWLPAQPALKITPSLSHSKVCLPRSSVRSGFRPPSANLILFGGFWWAHSAALQIPCSISLLVGCHCGWYSPCPPAPLLRVSRPPPKGWLPTFSNQCPLSIFLSWHCCALWPCCPPAIPPPTEVLLAAHSFSRTSVVNVPMALARVCQSFPVPFSFFSHFLSLCFCRRANPASTHIRREDPSAPPGGRPCSPH